MLYIRYCVRVRFPSTFWGALTLTWLLNLSGGSAAESATNDIVILEIAGTAETLRNGQAQWQPADANGKLRPGDRFRTGKDSRATLRLTDLSQLRVGALTELQVRLEKEPGHTPLHKLWRGVIYFFHRDKPGRVRFDTPIAAAAVRGTEFTLMVEETGRSVLTLFDGLVELSSADGAVEVQSGEQAVAEIGNAPRTTAVIRAQLQDTVQWALYYPAVLHLEELGFAQQEILTPSLTAYARGDLLTALANYPPGREPASDGERVYLAGLLLAVGQVERAETMLDGMREAGTGTPGPVTPPALAEALRRLVVIVKGGQNQPANRLGSATEWLVESYAEQARARLPLALMAARRATEIAPNFSFAWARRAELEFGFRQTRRAAQAVQRALALAPRNAQAISLQGFLLTAEGRITEAIAQFDRAIEIDGALGNAWLGRGLCWLRRGEKRLGLLDLQTAAVLEPQRSMLRSYLGKGFETGQLDAQAERELELARQLDPRDPTPWLYSALFLWEQHRFNEAISDLERSIELNDNRAIYRSRFLLDEDRAVRSSSLATVYRSAGMAEVGVREAARAVSYDYANYSAHLFFSESYNALRDPTRVHLRHETVWFNELLLANLLAPVGGTPLSPNISQQEYTRLFEQNRFGLTSSTEYRSDGQFLELASQFGIIGNTGWSLDLDYQHDNGTRPNDDLERIEWYTTVKQQISPRDSVLLLAKYQDFHAGDNSQVYDQSEAHPTFHWDEYESPILVGGYHREWAPGSHTLLLGGRLEVDQFFTADQFGQSVLSRRTRASPLTDRLPNYVVTVDMYFRSIVEIYTAEAQQIFENQAHTFLVGGRWQNGEIEGHSVMSNPSQSVNRFQDPPADIHTTDDFQRWSAYAYETLKLPWGVRLTGGVTFEDMTYPANFHYPPIQPGEQHVQTVDPKAALLWEVTPQATIRGLYAQALGGISLDESYRLEPTQLVGFGQAFRNVIPESQVGSLPASEHQIGDVALDLKFKSRTYVGLSAEIIQTEATPTTGLYHEFTDELGPPFIFPAGARRHHDYEERSLRLAINQLISEQWSLGARYAFTRSDLTTTFPGLGILDPPLGRQNHAELQHLNLWMLFNHWTGLFVQFESEWYGQKTLADSPPLADETVQQFNFYLGYRFPRQRGDITLGLLNLTGQDYRLNPITPYSDLPRERVYYARLRFRF